METEKPTPVENPAPADVEATGPKSAQAANPQQHTTKKASTAIDRPLVGRESRSTSNTQGAAEKTATKTEVPPPPDVAATKEYESLGEIDIDIAKYTSDQRALRARPMWVDALKGIAGGVAALLALRIWGTDLPKDVFSLRWQAGIAALASFLVFAVFAALKQAHLSSLDAALDILRVRRRTMQPVLRDAPETESAGSAPSYFDRLVDINVANLGSYYSLVRLHNDKSFVVSVWVGMLGFALILAAVGFSLFAKDSKTLPTSIAAGSGVMTEFIAAVFFFLYNRSVRQMRDYFQGLLVVQNVLLSLKLVTDTRDEGERAKMVSLMLSYLTRNVLRPEPSDDSGEEGTRKKSSAAKA